MRLARDLLIGGASSVWTVVVSLLAVPVYLDRLGVEAYGLVGMVTTLQALLQVLDFGMAPTINREMARSRGAGGAGVADLLRVFSLVAYGIAALVAVVLMLAAPWIATHWVKATALPAGELVSALVAIALLVACRWPLGLFQGALLGAQRLVDTSVISMAMVFATHIGGIAVITFGSPSITALFAWQSLVAVLHVLLLRRRAWSLVGAARRPRDWSQLRRVWRFSAGMGAVGITGLLVGQVDKVLLSTLLRLEELGYYMLATSIVAVMAVLVVPTFNALFPRFAAGTAAGDQDGVRSLYLLGTRTLASIVFPIAALLIAFGEPLVRVWVGDPGVAARVAPILALLAAGSAIHAVMFLPYALQVAAGRTRVLLYTNLALIAFQFPLLVFLAGRYGAVGAGLAWVALHAVYFSLGVPATRAIAPPRTQGAWLLDGLCVPALLAAASAAVGVSLIRPLDWSPMTQLVAAAVLLVLTATSSALTYRPLREAVVRTGTAGMAFWGCSR